MKNIIVTTAQIETGAQAGLLANLKLFCKDHDVDEVIVLVSDHRRTLRALKNEPTMTLLHNDIKTLDLPNVRLLDKTPKNGIILNKNLRLFHSQIVPQAVNPLLGLPSKMNRDYSYVVNATKVRFETIPSKRHQPRLITTTGALTRPNYNEQSAMGTKARQMHQYGFTFIQVHDEKRFTVHPIMATEWGSFTFKTTKYEYIKKKATSTPKQRYEALVLGDLHDHVTCKNALYESINQIKTLNPKRIFLHDVFDGHSINPHASSNVFYNSNQHLTLEEEVTHLLNTLTYLSFNAPDTNIYVVRSNHDDFIERYIHSGQFMNDKTNSMFIVKSLQKILTSDKPALYTLMRSIPNTTIPANVIFLTLNSEIRVRGILCSDHGHKGSNGARGSYKGLEKINARSITGHAHSPVLYSNGAVAGHLTDQNKQHYTDGGMTSWLQANVGIDCIGNINMLILNSNFKQEETK